jgi:hypothetical protein
MKHLADLCIEPQNRLLLQKGKEETRMLVYRTKGEYWGKQRAVVDTYNPTTERSRLTRLTVNWMRSGRNSLP